jgi:AmmeMemoRadiSam system protein B
MPRNPYVAGYFYPGSAAEIEAMMAEFVDRDAPKEDAVGVLVPHAGYQYSGAVTGATLSRIKFKDTFIIMGPTHSGQGKPSASGPGAAGKRPWAKSKWTRNWRKRW